MAFSDRTPGVLGTWFFFSTLSFFSGHSEFKLLMRDVISSKRQAYANGTYSNLNTQFRSYFSYCVYFQRNPLPADADTICGYAQFLGRSLQPGAISNYLSGVRTLHSFAGLHYDFSEDFHLQLVIKGISRIKPHVPCRASPITPQILVNFYRHMDHSSSLHLTVWACCLILFFTLARLGSILPASSNLKHTNNILTSERVNFCSEGLVVTLLHTKTIQFGRRRLHIPLLQLDSVLCPVSAYTRCLQAVGFRRHHPAFVFLDKGKLVWLTTTKFIHTFRLVTSKFLDADVSSFTGHSFRRGGATWAFQSGVPGELIQVMGDWASDAYKKYLEFSLDNKIQLAALFSHKLPRS